MITNEDIIYNHNLINFEYLDWSKFQYDYSKYGNDYIYIIFKELDCDRYTKSGQQLMSITHYEYPILLTSAIKCLDYIHNYSLYNQLFTILCEIHSRNVECCAEYNSQLKDKQKSITNRPKKAKVKDEYIRSVSTDMFTGKTNYIYSNLKTGDEIISDNPNLLEELNKPKERKKKKDKTVKIINLPAGFTFKFK